MAVMRRWRTAVVAAFPHTQHRRQWVREVCLLQPVDRIAPGAARMQDLLAGCWVGRPPAHPWSGAALGQRRAMDERSAYAGGRAGPGREGCVTPSRPRSALPVGCDPLRPGAAPHPPPTKPPPVLGSLGRPPLGVAAHHPVSGGWGVAAGAAGLGCPPPPANCFVRGSQRPGQGPCGGTVLHRTVVGHCGRRGGGGIMHRTVEEAVAALAAALPVLTDV